MIARAKGHQWGRAKVEMEHLSVLRRRAIFNLSIPPDAGIYVADRDWPKKNAKRH